jgi:hypothetical protein
MGWKAAQKLIRHWRILRGDNVREKQSKIISTLLFNVFYDFCFLLFLLFAPFNLHCLDLIVVGDDYKGQRQR